MQLVYTNFISWSISRSSFHLFGFRIKKHDFLTNFRLIIIIILTLK